MNSSIREKSCLYSYPSSRWVLMAPDPTRLLRNGSSWIPPRCFFLSVSNDLSVKALWLRKCFTIDSSMNSALFSEFYSVLNTLLLKKEGKYPSQIIELIKWPHQDSNLDQLFRKQLFYPLNYGANLDCKSMWSTATRSQLTPLPSSTILSGCMNDSFPSASSAISIMPWLSTPRIFRGSRLQSRRTCWPIISSGL